MKTAVVLSGGGTRGAYELGAWRAFRELGIEYHIVTGTSIGSINGAMMCIGNYERTEEMWLGLKMTDMLTEKTGSSVGKKIASLFSFGVKKGTSDDRLIAGAVDNSPFANFINTWIEEDKMRNSPIDYGLVTVRMKDRKPFMLSKDQIPQGKMKDYVTASASVFPIFPLHEIDGDYYIDGCYHDNLPIDLAIRMGAQHVIVVDLHITPQHENYAERPYTTYITPSEDTGPVLAFDPAKIRYNIEMGYRDAMRTFGKFKGFTYYFKPEGLKEFENAMDYFSMGCMEGEAAIGLNLKKKKGKQKIDRFRMFKMFSEYARGRGVTKEDYFIRGAEITADVFGLDHTKIWDMKDFVKEAFEKLGPESKYPEASTLLNGETLKVAKKLYLMQKEQGSDKLAGSLYYFLTKNEPDYEKLSHILSFFPKELAAQLFLYSVRNV